MNRLKGALVPILAAVLLLSCAAGLPPSLQREIATENARLSADEQELHRSRARVEADLSQAADMFQGVPEPGQWMANLNAAQAKLDSAKADSQQISRLHDEGQIRRLLADEITLRQGAEVTWRAQESAAQRWIAFRQNLPSSLSALNSTYQSLHSVDLAGASQTVAKAEKDWPAKKADLESRLSTLRGIAPKADTEWNTIAHAREDAAAGKATGPEIATLIEADDRLSQQARTLTSGPAELTNLSGQLYEAWDKILTDLDQSHYGVDTQYRERVKTVRTHFADATSKKGETKSEEHWYNISQPAYHALEKDIGMAIGHKDAGLYDSEAQTIPQPPGYSYIAPPEQGSNQYGYWTHDPYGHSVWAWLPEYLILRELLWNHDYHPVIVSDYSAYRYAQRSGTSYYGQETPNSPPKYGSHGTFTQNHYASSRYVQSGGFQNSAYASRASAPSQPRASIPSQSYNNSSAGKRFGRQPGSAPSGQRFGRPSGAGRGFGRRR